MEFPKKITRSILKDQIPADILIRGSGESGYLRIVEYVLVKFQGTIVRYKQK